MTDAEKTAMAEVAALMRHGVDMRAAERRERIATAKQDREDRDNWNRRAK